MPQFSNFEITRDIVNLKSLRYSITLQTSGPLWVSRIGKEDSALIMVKVRNEGESD